MQFEVYCDEANPDVLTSAKPRAQHLMIGSVWLPAERRDEIKAGIDSLRQRHSAWGEIKWNKVSPNRQAFYLDLVDLFFGHGGLNLDAANNVIRREDVIRELDRRLRREAILQPKMIAWLSRLLDELLARGFELSYLARSMNRLADAAARRLDGLLGGLRRDAFQQSLLEGTGRARMDNHFEFQFAPKTYPARWLFTGRYDFSKHYYPLPGELNEDLTAEETACAIELDSMSEVEFWVRNLERHALSSFWLPTSTDRFYPDFVAQLKDGRLFVVEYKGGDRYSNEDSREKRNIGKVWAAASGRSCKFAMVTDAKTAGKSVAAQLRDAIA